MRDLHQLLAELALVATSEPRDIYDAETVALVEAFQRTRGLPLTGVVDQTTFERLDEARWQLGQRLLYDTRPRLRGDDVAELQVLLAQLGFNPGRIDGIYGSLTATALGEFQRNRDLETSEALTKATLQELSRVRATNAGRRLVTDARDLAGFDPQAIGSVLLCGEGPLATALATCLSDAPLVHARLDLPHEESADFANDHDVALVLSFEPLQEVEGIHLHYWASYRSHSHRGELFASSLAAVLAQIDEGPRVEVTGMALPILRETKMTTVHVEHGNVAEQVLHQVITALEGLVEQVIHRAE